jgi:hypothetical protein
MHSSQEGTNSRDYLLAGILHDIMRRLVQAVRLGIRKDVQKVIQAYGSEAPVPHAPDQLHRPLGQLSEFLLQLLQYMPGWVTWRGGYVFDKPVDGDAMIPAVVGCQQSGPNVSGENSRVGHRHP